MAGPNAQVHYALEGSVAVGGSSIQWYVFPCICDRRFLTCFTRLRDNLGIIEHPRQAGELAEQVEDTGGVYFVTVCNSSLSCCRPFAQPGSLVSQGFSGLFAP